MKNCRNCGDLPLENFFPRPDRFCKECIRQRDRDRNQYRKTYRAEYDRIKKYGLSEEAYQSMLQAQEHKCAICYTHMQVPQVDHCHAEGHVRGLLCNRCNLGIGYFDDDPERFVRTAQYLGHA